MQINKTQTVNFIKYRIPSKKKNTIKMKYTTNKQIKIINVTLYCYLQRFIENNESFDKWEFTH